MEKAEKFFAILGLGFTIGVVVVVFLVFAVGAMPKTITVGGIEFEIPTSTPNSVAKGQEPSPIIAPSSTSTSIAEVLISTPIVVVPQSTNTIEPTITFTPRIPFADWELPYPQDINKRLEFRRCEQYPEYGFPEFGSEAGTVPLPLHTGKIVNGQLAWCFEVRFITPIDEWKEYVKQIDPVFQTKEPEGLAVYFSKNNPQPSGLTVIIDDGKKLAFPPDGVAINRARVIRVFIPSNASRPPTVTTGPFEVGATFVVR